jgi:hypothetical protein
MVGQAARAADMRVGNVPKCGMKAMNGGGGSMSRSTNKHVDAPVEKAKPKPKPTSHSQMAQQWEANGRDANGKLVKHVEKKQGWTKDEINAARDRAADERQRQGEAAKVKMIAADDAGEELEPVPDGPAAAEQVRTRLAELAGAMEALTTDDAGAAGTSSAGALDEGTPMPPEELAQCLQSQLDELACLEAMFPEGEFRLLSPAPSIEALRAALEVLDAAPDDAAALAALAAHPPLEFALALTVSSDEASEASEAAAQLVGTVLLRVRFPKRYMHPDSGVPPQWDVEDAMVAPAAARKLSDDGRRALDEARLLAGLREQAAALAPTPCVYEVVAWMSEHLLAEYVRRDVLLPLLPGTDQ